MFKVTTKWVCCGEVLSSKTVIVDRAGLNEILDKSWSYTDIEWEEV